MTALLRCVGVQRSYGAVRALDGVDLAVEQGARHALIGPNGAGKTTLLRLIAGTQRLTEGGIWFAGQDVTGNPETHRARHGIGQTFQQSSLFRTLTAADNVALAVQRRHGRPWLPVPARPRWAARVDELLALVGLAHRSTHRVDTLPYAECRLLEVAVALATEPRLLLLDEPMAGVSSAASTRLLDLLRGLPADITLVFVEHDLDVVFGLASTITVLHLGRVLMTGTPAEVQASPQVRHAYLGTGRRGDLFSTDDLAGDEHVATGP
ncbi:MAG TPA: ABC transporter ATP-binding protein [Mycobacteriales bacterium]|nr:ABC transporter ATP-binding protein [Mycobacteriales bacterium]